MMAPMHHPHDEASDDDEATYQRPPEPRPRVGDWSQSYTDRALYPYDLRTGDLCIEDIAHSLALLNRFGGHVREPYGVADHSLRVEAYVAEHYPRRYPHATAEHVRQARLAALMHDAPESVVGDMIRPLKHDERMRAYRDVEQRIAKVVETWLGLPIGALDWMLVKEADDVVLVTEQRDLRGPPPMPWRSRGVQPMTERIIPRGWREAEDEFLARFRELTEGHRPHAGKLPHYHSCPWCYERKPCTRDCTIEGDLSDDGVNCGAHAVCDECAQLAPPDRPASALDEDLPAAVRYGDDTIPTAPSTPTASPADADPAPASPGLLDHG